MLAVLAPGARIKLTLATASYERRRSGEFFTFTWDNLGRLTVRDAPGNQPDVPFGYDLLGRECST
jgi:hypothetical protein